MSKLRYKTVVFGAAILTLVAGVALQPRALSSPATASLDGLPESESPTLFQRPPARDGGVFYLARRDVRRCISPLCGGWWVKRVNRSWTRCANHNWMSECYVPEIDWNGRQQVEPGNAVLRGEIIARRFGRFGNLGVLWVNESWQGVGDKRPLGTFYRVRDRGVRCITHPCLSHSAAKLNSTILVNIAGVDPSAADVKDEQISEAAEAMTKADGVIVAGSYATVTGPGGTARTLKVTKFYLNAATGSGGPPSSGKRCFKTGCSGQVCADHNVVTTCEFRPEYACYQKASCERQPNGDCGFTQTAELKICLAGAKR